MSPTRPDSALEVIDRLTLQLAAHNADEQVLPDSELQVVLNRLRAANVAVGHSMNPPRRKKSPGSNASAFEHYVQLFAIAGLISFFVILFGILLHGMFQMMAMSMTSMHPGP